MTTAATWSRVSAEMVEKAPLTTWQIHARSGAVGSVTSCLFGMSSVFCHWACQRSVAVAQSTGQAQTGCLNESLLQGWLSMSRRSSSSGWRCTLVRRREVIASLLMSGGMMLLSMGSHSVFVQQTTPDMVLMA